MVSLLGLISIPLDISSKKIRILQELDAVFYLALYDFGILCSTTFLCTNPIYGLYQLWYSEFDTLSYG